MDQWNLLDEFNLLNNLSKDFHELISSKKWSERRDGLQAMIDLCEKNPRLTHQTNYRELLSKLLDIVKKDSNVVCVTLGIRCLTALVRGLRHYFSVFAPMVARILLEKFKETKQAVRSALTESVDAIFFFCGFKVVQEPVKEILQNNPNPAVIANTELLIYRILLHCISENEVLAFVRSIALFVAQHSSSGDASVRDASYMIFAGVLRLFGEKTTATIFENAFCDTVKRKKVDEFYGKAVAEAVEIGNEREQQLAFSQNLDERKCGSVVRLDKEVFEDASIAEEVDIWESLEAVDITGNLPTNFDSLVMSKQWKERKEALEALLCLLEKNQRLKFCADHAKLIDLLAQILGKDVNINVAALAAKALSLFVTGLRYDFAPYASTVLPSALQKFKEKKAVLRVPLNAFVDSVGIYAPLSHYIGCIEYALNKGNPQVNAQTALFLSRLWKQHDSSCLPFSCVKEIAPLLVQRTCDPDPECRDAAYAAIAAAMKAIGEDAVKLLFPEVAQDELKMLKIKEKHEEFLKECGLNASVLVLRLYKAFPTRTILDEPSKSRNTKFLVDGNVKKRTLLAHSQAVMPKKAHEVKNVSTRPFTSQVRSQSGDVKRNRPKVIQTQVFHSSEATNSAPDSRNPRKKDTDSKADSFKTLTASETANNNSESDSKSSAVAPCKVVSRPRSQPSLIAKYSSLQSGKSRIPLPSSKK